MTIEDEDTPLNTLGLNLLPPLSPRARPLCARAAAPDTLPPLPFILRGLWGARGGGVRRHVRLLTAACAVCDRGGRDQGGLARRDDRDRDRDPRG
eukprot:49702-Rhodomonas_salina.4